MTITLDLQPTLTGDLLELRPLRRDDFEALYAVARDPLIWEQHPANDRWKREVFEQFFEDAMASGGALAVFDRATGAMIGSSRYNAYDPIAREVEIGWTFLARPYWGGIYNGEMKRLMLAHAFQAVDTVIFIVGLTNWRSQRAVEKIGGIRAGTRVDATGRESLVFRLQAPRPPRQEPQPSLRSRL